MKLQIVRAVVAAAIILIALTTPLIVDSAPPLIIQRLLSLDRLAGGRIEAAVLFDDNDEDNDDDGGDNDEDNDDDDGDNDEDNDDGGDNDEDNDDGGDNDEDNDEDNEGGDNDEDNDDDGGDNNEDNDDGGDNDDDEDEFEDADNVAVSGAPAGTAPAVGPSFDPSVTQATGVTTGSDSAIGLPGDRVAIRVFPWMPAGVSISLHVVDSATVPATSGARIAALTFQVEAKDGSGIGLSSLPAEVNLSARYTDQEASGLNKGQLALLWLDPTDSTWKPAPKQGVEPSTNYVAASVTALGIYTVAAP